MERQFDVIVVGGGTAGFAAAVTAARGGAKTLLIEEKAYLGGTATGAQVSMFMGFADGEPDRPQQGIIKDVMDGLAAAGGTPASRRSIYADAETWISQSSPMSPRYSKI